MKVKFISYLILIPVVVLIFMFLEEESDVEKYVEDVYDYDELAYDDGLYQYNEYETLAEAPAYEIPEYEPEPLPEEDIVGFAEIEPEFPGGEVAMNDFIAENIVYPEFEREMGLEGTVYVQFVVDTEGDIRNAEIVKDVPGAVNFGPEVLRVVNSMPAWTPGKYQGEDVNVRFTLPVKFKIQ